MSGLVKNAIAQQLQLFCKNISPQQLSVSVLKGEGSLPSAELDECYLQVLLNLPMCFVLSRAGAENIRFKVNPLKASLQISIASIQATVEVDDSDADAAAAPASARASPALQLARERLAQKMAHLSAPRKYGFSQKLIDGMHIHVESVVLRMRTAQHEAAFELRNATFGPVNRSWHPVEPQRSRVLLRTQQCVLIHRCLWIEDTRLHVGPHGAGPDDAGSGGIALEVARITARIVAKRRLADSALVHMRTAISTDEIAWQLNQSEMLTGIEFVNYLLRILGNFQEHERQRAASVPSMNQRPAAAETAHPATAGARAASSDGPAAVAVDDADIDDDALLADDAAAVEASAEASAGGECAPPDLQATEASLRLGRVILRMANRPHESAIAMLIVNRLELMYWPGGLRHHREGRAGPVAAHDAPRPEQPLPTMQHSCGSLQSPSSPTATNYARWLRSRTVQIRCGDVVIFPTQCRAHQHPDFLQLLRIAARKSGGAEGDSVRITITVFHYSCGSQQAYENGAPPLPRSRVLAHVGPATVNLDRLHWFAVSEYILALLNATQVGPSKPRERGDETAANGARITIILHEPTIVLPPTATGDAVPAASSLVLRVEANRVTLSGVSGAAVSMAPATPVGSVCADSVLETRSVCSETTVGDVRSRLSVFQESALFTDSQCFPNKAPPEDLPVPMFGTGDDAESLACSWQIDVDQTRIVYQREPKSATTTVAQVAACTVSLCEGHDPPLQCTFVRVHDSAFHARIERPLLLYLLNDLADRVHFYDPFVPLLARHAAPTQGLLCVTAPRVRLTLLDDVAAANQCSAPAVLLDVFASGVNCLIETRVEPVRIGRAWPRPYSCVRPARGV